MLMKNWEQVRAAILERGGIFFAQPLSSPPAASPSAAGVQQISAFCSLQCSGFILFSGSSEKEISHGRRALLAAGSRGTGPPPCAGECPRCPRPQDVVVRGQGAGAGLLERTRSLQIEQELLAAVNLISCNLASSERAARPGRGGGWGGKRWVCFDFFLNGGNVHFAEPEPETQ